MMKNWLLLTLGFLILTGCQNVQPQAPAPEAKRSTSAQSTPSPTADQGKDLFEPAPDLFSAYFTVSRIHGADALAIALNGEASTMLIKLDGKVIADLQEGEAIRLNLLPHTTYHFAFKNTFWSETGMGLTKWTLNTDAKGEGGAWDIKTPLIVGNRPEIETISASTLRSKAKVFPFVEPLVSRQEIALAPSDFPQQIESCLRNDEIAPCQDLQAKIPASLLPEKIGEHVAALEAQKLAVQQKLAQLESSLPPQVLRDKYMVQLSSFLKQQKYTDALEIFPKLEALPIATDPSLKFFYGESLLKTGQPGKALQKLYQYINEQGTGSTHYAQALEMISQAESKL